MKKKLRMIEIVLLISGILLVVCSSCGSDMDADMDEIALSELENGIALKNSANCNNKLDTPWQKTLVTYGSTGSIRERGCRSRQAANTQSRKASNPSSGVLRGELGLAIL